MDKNIKITVAIALSLLAHGTIRPAAELTQAAGHLIAYNEPAKRLFKKNAPRVLAAVALYELSRKAYNGFAPVLNRWAEQAARNEQLDYSKTQPLDKQLDVHLRKKEWKIVLEYLSDELETPSYKQGMDTLEDAVENSDPCDVEPYLENRHILIFHRGPQMPFFKTADKRANIIITKYITKGFLRKKLQKLSGIDPTNQVIQIHSASTVHKSSQFTTSHKSAAR